MLPKSGNNNQHSIAFHARAWCICRKLYAALKNKQKQNY